MLDIKNKVKEINNCSAAEIPFDVLSSEEPLILKGLTNNWPIVQAGLVADNNADSYIRSFYNKKTVQAFFGAPEIQGRYFYNDEMTGLNFDFSRVQLNEILDKIKQHKNDSQPPSFYIGSTTIDSCLPGFRNNNDLNLNSFNPQVSIWIGNASRIACHYDAQNNIACSVVGRRRFTLFAPDQIDNLYIGPIDFTPAGQPASVVNFANPDFDKYPRFRLALECAQVAELEPGDALYLPSMWWHYVEGLEKFNVLVNYWWTLAPSYAGPAIGALNHAIMSIRDLPSKEKQAWKHLFDYYIFNDNKLVTEHIPEKNRGILESLDDTKARQLRTKLINSLNR